MTKVGAQRAADLTGRSKSTIQRAMTAGKLPFETDETGHRLIDVADLEKLFGLRPEGQAPQESREDEDGETSQARLEIERLRQQVEHLEARIAETQDQCEAWRKQAQEAMIACQAAQKQVDVFAETIRERDRREDERRRQALEARAKAAGKDVRPRPSPPENQNVLPSEDTPPSAHRPLTDPRPEESAPEPGSLLDFQNLWQRIKTRTGGA